MFCRTDSPVHLFSDDLGPAVGRPYFRPFRPFSIHRFFFDWISIVLRAENLERVPRVPELDQLHVRLSTAVGSETW